MKWAISLDVFGLTRSHPSRGGWIEIYILDRKRRGDPVPPLTGWVD